MVICLVFISFVAEIQNSTNHINFLKTSFLKKKTLVNPYGLGSVAAYGVFHLILRLFIPLPLKTLNKAIVPNYRNENKKYCMEYTFGREFVNSTFNFSWMIHLSREKPSLLYTAVFHHINLVIFQL